MTSSSSVPQTGSSPMSSNQVDSQVSKEDTRLGMKVATMRQPESYISNISSETFTIQPDPHSVHSDYSSDFSSMGNEKASMELPVRPGRGRPRKVTSIQGNMGHRSSSAAMGMIPKRTTPRSSLAPPGANASMMMMLSVPGTTTEGGMGTGPSALVFKCPVVQCERIYATKLALKRHFQVYQHELIYDGPLESVLVVSSNEHETGTDTSLTRSLGSVEGLQTSTGASVLDSQTSSNQLRRILPKLYKCPVLQCLEKFPTENELASHWKHIHPTLKGSLGEWSSLLYEFDAIQLTPVEHPATYLKELEGNIAAWQFHSIFQVLGPQPALKLTQIISQLRSRLGTAFAVQSSTLLLDEMMLGLVLQVTLYELMPKAFLLTRDPDPTRASLSSDYDVWKDEPWLRAIDAESAQTLLHYGSAHTSRTFKRKANLDPADESTNAGEMMASSTNFPIEDRFVCQVPGCAKVFASLPAYKYHMHHYEHDLEILIRCSILLRRVLFAPLVAGGTENHSPDDSQHPSPIHDQRHEFMTEKHPAIIPERWVFQIDSSSSNQISIWDRIICLPDVVHILHGYIDQQLPLLFSFHFSKKRNLALMPGEFLISVRKEEKPDILKRELLDALIERKTRDGSRRKRPDPSLTMTMSSGQHPQSDLYYEYQHQLVQGQYPLTPTQQQLNTNAFYHLPSIGTNAIGTGDDNSGDASQRSFISLLCKFVTPNQLERYQSRRILAGMVVPGSTSTTNNTLLVSPAPGNFSSGTIPIVDLFQNCFMTMIETLRPTQVNVIISNPHHHQNSLITDESITASVTNIDSSGDTTLSRLDSNSRQCQSNTNEEYQPFISEESQSSTERDTSPSMATTEVIPWSGLHLSSTDALAYGDGTSLASADFFPLVVNPIIAKIDFALTWLAVGGANVISTTLSSHQKRRSSIFFWAIFLSFDSITLGYRIAKAPALISVISPFTEESSTMGGDIITNSSDNIDQENNTNILLSSDQDVDPIVMIRWCPFLFNASATTGNVPAAMTNSSTRALLAILYASGYIGLFSIATASMLPLADGGEVRIEDVKVYHMKESSRLVIPSYTITCFSWCKVPGSPLRIVAGTKEGYIALFDLTNVSNPVLLLMNSGHPTMISSVDWSMTDVNKVITSSFDNTVMLWLLDNMYARTTLLHSRLPFLSAHWLHTSPVLGTYSNNIASGAYSGLSTSYSGGNATSSVMHHAWDPVNSVVAVDESNLAKIVLLNEPGRVITLASNAPRMWVTVYPNSRYGGTLLAMANWHGKVELFGTPDPRSKKGDSANIASWSYNRACHTFSVYLPPATDALDLLPVDIMNDPMEIVNITWHPVPVGLFAVISATGIIHVHCS